MLHIVYFVSNRWLKEFRCKIIFFLIVGQRELPQNFLMLVHVAYCFLFSFYICMMNVKPFSCAMMFWAILCFSLVALLVFYLFCFYFCRASCMHSSLFSTAKLYLNLSDNWSKLLVTLPNDAQIDCWAATWYLS